MTIMTTADDLSNSATTDLTKAIDAILQHVDSDHDKAALALFVTGNSLLASLLRCLVDDLPFWIFCDKKHDLAAACFTVCTGNPPYIHEDRSSVSWAKLHTSLLLCTARAFRVLQKAACADPDLEESSRIAARNVLKAMIRMELPNTILTGAALWIDQTEQSPELSDALEVPYAFSLMP